MSGTSIRIESLGSDNYDTWKLQAEAILTKNDLWGYVSGDIRKPDATSSNLPAWVTSDKKAKSDLILTISPSELKQIKNCSTSRDIWQKLENIYQSKGPARKATLLKRITLTKMKEGDNVREHLAEFFDAVDKLEEIGLKINPDLLAILLLYSLPDSFENFRCAMETRDELPGPDILKVKINEEHESRMAKDDNNVQNVMFAKKSTGKHKFTGPKEGKHTEGGDQKSPHFKVKCERCNKLGHVAKYCRSKFPARHQSARQAEADDREEDSGSSQREEIAMLNTEKKPSGEWCLDSGCTSHMASQEDHFKSLSRIDRTLNLANKESSKITGIGNVKLTIAEPEGERLLNLENVLHVPDLRTNLLSVAKITDKNHEVLFKKNEAIVMTKDKEPLITAYRSGDLYFLREETDNARIAESKNPPYTELQDWHRKMGHVNEKDLREMARKNAVHGLKFENDDVFPACEVCITQKQTRAPFFKPQENRTEEPLEIVHTDVCGPMRKESLSGSKYFVTFIDDRTRWCEVYFIRSKADLLKTFQTYKAAAENHTGRKIKALQSDNGTEYCNGDFDKYLAEHGIQRRLTAPYTPEQNGIAERKNRTLVEMARCMMKEGNMPPWFWAEAINAANYTRNRCITKPLQGETPYKLWYGKTPTVTYFKVFGSKAFVLDKKQQKGKFDSRSSECIFVGYSTTSKAYRLWSPETKKVLVSRDVKFIDEPNSGDKYEEIYDDEINSQDQMVVELCNAPPPHLHKNVINTKEAVQRRNTWPTLTPTKINKPQAPTAKRGRGRPKLVRTGSVGRPRKTYQTQQTTESTEESDDTETSSDELNEDFSDAFANIAELQDPITLDEAMTSEDAAAWERALLKEYSAQIKNKTWEIVNRPTKQKVIGSRFVFKTKGELNTASEEKKVRLVAKGCSQRPGIDFNETYSPVARATSIRILVALSAELGLEIHQMDVVTAYLNGELAENVYMEIPDQLEESLDKIISTKKTHGKPRPINDEELLITAKDWKAQLNEGENKVCLLKRALYGLRQSGIQWHRRLITELQKLGLKPLDQDPCMFTRTTEDDIMIIVIYVDDILLATNNPQWMDHVKSSLKKSFEMKDLGPASHCVGIEFHQDDDHHIRLTQKQYTESILNRFGMQDCKPAVTPMENGYSLKKPEAVNAEEMCKYPYQHLIGSLMYLAIMTRPDIAFAVNFLSQFNTCHEIQHWKAAKRILRYLKGTTNLGLTYSKTGKPLFGNADADWGADAIDRRSYTGYAFILAGAAVSWEARKQRTVALSSTESEYMALSEATKEALYLQGILKPMGLAAKSVTIFNDNLGAQELVKSNAYHARTKHIDVKHHFVRKAYKHGRIQLEYLPTESMPADILTKGLNGPKTQRCLRGLGVHVEPGLHPQGS